MLGVALQLLPSLNPIKKIECDWKTIFLKLLKISEEINCVVFFFFFNHQRLVLKRVKFTKS